MTLSEYEKKEWIRLQQRKADTLSKQARHLLPTAARDRISAVVDVVKQAPAAELAGSAYASAATGLGKIIGSAASFTVNRESVVKQFRGAGHEIAALDDIQELDLWEEVSGRGTVWTFTVVHRPGHPAWTTEVPYVLAVVELDEGPRLMTNVLIDPSNVRVGLRVRAVAHQAPGDQFPFCASHRRSVRAV